MPEAKIGFGYTETERSKAMTWSVRVGLVAGLVFAATPALASTTAGITSEPVAGGTALLKVAQGMTPEGWRVEGPPRYKKATTKSKISEPTYFREEGPPRYKKSKSTTGSGR